MTPPISNNKHKKQTMSQKITKEIEISKTQSQVTPVTHPSNTGGILDKHRDKYKTFYGQ